MCPFPGASLLDSDSEGHQEITGLLEKGKGTWFFLFSTVSGSLVHGRSLQPFQVQQSVPCAAHLLEMFFTMGASCSPSPGEWPPATAMAGCVFSENCAISQRSKFYHYRASLLSFFLVHFSTSPKGSSYFRQLRSLLCLKVLFYPSNSLLTFSQLTMFYIKCSLLKFLVWFLSPNRTLIHLIH